MTKLDKVAFFPLMRVLLLVFTSIFVFRESFAFSSVPLEKNSYYDYFKNISLPYDANVTSCVLQDVEGYIWIGTKKGLLRYNGYNVQRYIYHQEEKYNDQNSIQTMVFLDADRLLLGTDGGILCFNIRTLRYEDCPQAWRGVHAVRGLVLHGDLLGIGTRDSGFYLYHLKSGKLHSFGHGKERETIVRTIDFIDGNIYVGGFKGLFCYAKDLRGRKLIQLPSSEPLQIYSTLYIAKSHQLLVGTDMGLYSYDLRTSEAVKLSFLPTGIVESLCMDQHGNLIIGTENGLYVRESSGKVQHHIHDVRNAHSLCNNFVKRIFIDRDGYLWVATSHGVSVSMMLPWYKQRFLSELSNTGYGNLINSLCLDANDNYWMGGDNGLIYFDSMGKQTWYHQNNPSYPLKVNQIRNIYKDREGELWIMTDGGVARHDRRTGQFVYYNIRGAGGRNTQWAYNMYEDDLGRLWISTFMGGLFIIDKRRLLRSQPGEVIYDDGDYLKGNKEKLNTIYHMVADEAGHVWANTSRGLVEIDVRTLEVKEKKVFLDNLLYANGYVWYSNTGKVYRMNTSTSVKERLPIKISSGSVYAFVSDGSRVWYSCVDGIFSLDVKSKVVSQHSIPGSYYQSAIYDRLRNLIVWGGEDCFTTIYLDGVERKQKNKQVRISSVQVGGLDLTPLEFLNDHNYVHLKNGENVVLELSSLNYSPQNDEKFYYRIDDGEWQSLRKGDNRLMFAELPYGSRKIYLSNSNPSADSNAYITTYDLKVDYPWYLSWFSFLVYFSLLLALAYYVLKYLHAKNLKQYKERERLKTLALAKQKMDFFVNISHELKTPLSLIIAPLSKIIAESSNTSEKEKLSVVHRNAIKLNTLIYKVLDFQQMEYESEDTLIRSHVELNSLLRNCIRNFEGVIKDRHIEVDLRSNEDELWMNIDLFKIETVVTNILSNAIKYCNEKDGRISVDLKADDLHVRICIKDNGEGIRSEEGKMLFVRFFQGKNSTDQKEGTGIGLYLVKKFVELHHGEVEIQNDGGAKVTVVLPRKGENSIVGHSVQEKATAHEIVRDDRNTVLVVDDNHEMVDFLSETLSNQYNCLTAYNGEEALNVLEKQKVDIIIVDQMMPVMNGLDFCRKIRRDGRFMPIPVIMLSAKDDIHSEMEGMKVGVDVFISKPFDLKKLLLQMTQLIHRRHEITVSKKISAIVNKEPEVEKENVSPDEKLIEDITNVIELNMGKEDFGVNELAELLNMNSKQLYRKLKQLTGFTPIAYIKRLRMKKAAVLLSQQNNTVSEVMYLVGYSNSSYFTKCFSQEYGMTPKEWMQSKKDT